MTNQPRAALYLRSSKDRKDVSTQDQRDLLTQLAAERGLIIVEEFVDVVESGRDQDRPGFQLLLSAIANASRGWDRLLVRDTDRLSRAGWINGMVDHEVHKHGVEIIYANIPDVDPMTHILLTSIYRAQGQIHSIMSRDKGLAGMRQNVQRGFRAGGRAPWGYQLKHIGQGLVREGRELTKTVLEPNSDAVLAARYLKLRAAKFPRAKAMRDLGISLSANSLIGIEWNALTYAGCTVWNVHREASSEGGYRGQGKRRPRTDWVIRDDTHPALITRDEAERILHALENSDIGRAVSEAKRSVSNHLLSGQLRHPDGRKWEANGRYYRFRGVKNRNVQAELIERAVTSAIIEHLKSDELVQLLLDHASARTEIVVEPRKALQARIATVNATISRAMNAALMLEDPAPAMRKIDELERDRKRLVAEMAALDEEAELRKAAAQVRPETIKALLDTFDQAGDTADWKVLLQAMVDHIDLDPTDLSCRIHYRISNATWESVASLRGAGRFPTLRAMLNVAVAA